MTQHPEGVQQGVSQAFSLENKNARFPGALPVIFAGIKTSATIAATAAIVAEFVGANKGLGYVLLRGTSTMDIELVFAVLVVLTLIGVAINYLVEFCEWAMTPWQRSKNT